MNDSDRTTEPEANAVPGHGAGQAPDGPQTPASEAAPADNGTALLPDDGAPPGGQQPGAARPASAFSRSSLLGLAFDLLLVALIAVGVIFRFSWTNWNEDADLHPDEYGLTSTLTQLAIPDSLGDYFNTRISRMSPYQKYDIDGNPLPASGEYPVPDNRMRWGQWPLTIIRWTAEATGNTSYRELRLMGRRLSGLADALSLIVIFLIGWHLYSRRVGLLAAALSALAVMEIQQSHFMTADNFGTLFTALAMYAAVRAATSGPRRITAGKRDSWVEPGRAAGASLSVAGGDPQPVRAQHSWVWYGLFGVFFGMALATRINLLPLFGEILVAVVIAYAVEWQKGQRDFMAIVWDAGLRLALAGLAAFLTFRVTQPMSFRAEKGNTTLLTLRPNVEWVESMKVASAESSGAGGGPPGEQWTNRPALVFPWINMVVWGMGLPLGLTAWAGLLWAAWRCFQASDDTSWKRHALPLTWAGGYFLFMGTRWVKSVRYFLPIYPFMALLAAWAIVALWQAGQQRSSARAALGNQATDGGAGTPSRPARSSLAGLASSLSSLARPLSVVLGAVVLLGTLAWAWGFTSIYRHTNTRVAATRWAFQTLPGPFNLHLATAAGQYNEPLAAPDGITIGAESPFTLQFTSRVTGTVTGFSLGFARSPYDLTQPGILHVVLASDFAGTQPLAQADLSVPATSEGRGEPVAAEFAPAQVVSGTTYYVVMSTLRGGPVEVRGTTLAHESWDEPLPSRLDGRDPFGGLYTGLTMEVRWTDNEDKRQMFLANLPQVDYIFLPSQRGLWSVSRLPATYPLTMEYYRALFDGRLGFDLVQTFQSPITLGPLQISDAAGTWAWGKPPPLPPPGDYPFNNNPLAAEEAFSIYDHAPVWVFKKRADFNMDQARAVLNAIDLSQVVNLGPRETTAAPTLLRLSPQQLAQQRAGGTWSEMFDFDGLLNRFEWLGVIVWYLAVLANGWLAFPLGYVAFNGLPDRGYPLAKTLALLVVAWLVWMAGSVSLLPFTRATIALGFLVLAVVSGLIYVRRRAEINTFLRTQRRYILTVEALALGLFVLDLLIRLGNPDLWHPNFGGEKPMVFSFFNAVLKSTYFPPYNPWLAGYYLNYYYYGFVLISLLVKLLGIVPAFAYNLILPTLFSLVGINAFSGAFNLVAASREEPGPAGEGALAAQAQANELNQQRENGALEGAEVPGEPQAVYSGAAPMPADPLEAHELSRARSLNALAGGAASPLTLGDSSGQAHMEPGDNGAAQTTELAPSSDPFSVSSFQPPPSHAQPPVPPLPRAGANPYLAGFAAALLVVVLGNLAQVHTFLDGFRRAADRAELASSTLGDNDFTATVNGFWRVLTGESTIPIGTGSWYWDATRIIGGLNNGSNEITEFPFFTFLYADLHAHMIDMPFTLLSLAWAMSYLLASRPGQRRRGWLEWGAVWLVGGLALGVPRAANTWDYPLFLVLGVAAVAAGEWLRQPRLSRASVFNIGWRVVLLLVLVLAFYYPFDKWFAAAYSQVKRNVDSHAPLNAYLYIHGLFLFILASFLAWETRRWLAETPATVLTRAGDWLPMLALVAFGVIGAVAVLWYLDIPAGLVAVPLMAWAGLLLLRSPEAMPLSKRIVLFLLGTALAVTLFVELYSLEGDRMNTIFKFYIQVWVLLSVAAGAGLAWLWSALPDWTPTWRGVWTTALSLLVASAALYTVTATAAKVRDRFPAVTALPDSGCSPIPGMILPYDRGLPPPQQPRSLYGLDYMKWSAYCDRDAFLPLSYDHDIIRWLQDNVRGSPVIAEAQSFDLYRMSSRIAWNTGLPDVVGWDFHTRQHNGAIPTEFVTQRGNEVSAFYTTADLEAAMRFIRTYDVRYVIVGPLEQAYYAPSGGLAKFDALVSRGDLAIVFQNPGATIYAVTGPSTTAQ